MKLEEIEKRIEKKRFELSYAKMTKKDNSIAVNKLERQIQGLNEMRLNVITEGEAFQKEVQ
ncbi:MAG: hypothetical protein ACOC56_05745 [Atribacterota bacterium]